MATNRTQDSARLLLRLSGEFVVIVVGVLVALAVDGYVGRRAEREHEADALSTLRADLESSVENLRDDNRSTLRRVQLLDWFLAFPTDGSRAFPGDSLSRVESAVHITASYSPILRTYDALVATGSLSLLKNNEILFGLADIRRSADEYLDYREQTTDGWLFSLMPVWIRVLGVDFSPSEIPAALRNREFRAAVSVRRTYLRFTAQYGERLAAQMDEIIALVDEERSQRR